MGISKADSNIAYSVLEDVIRDDMDDTCPRAFCVLNPLKVTLTNWEGTPILLRGVAKGGDTKSSHFNCYRVDSQVEEFHVPRHPKRKDLGDRVVPFGKNLYIERSDFFDLHGPEGKLTGGQPPKGYKRLLPDDNVRLKYAYVIQCEEVVRDSESQEPVELKCRVFPETRAGTTPEGMARVKGIIHWVEASTAISCSVNQYDRLFLTEEPGKDSGDFLLDLNNDSLQVLKSVLLEPSVGSDALALLKAINEQAHSEEANVLSTSKLYHASLAYQFERSGYFALDPDSTGEDNLVFNRVATLRDTWGLSASAEDVVVDQRGRGSDRKSNDEKSREVEDVRRIAFRAATIVSVEPHPEAENLLVCKVDCGDGQSEGPRTVVAGLAGKIIIDELVGRHVVAVTNLKPSKMRGIESFAMLLAASDRSGNVELLQVSDTVPNGELIGFEGKDESHPDEMLKSKGALKAWERVKASLIANEDGECCFVEESTVHRMLTSAGPVRAASLRNAIVQ
jgi:methionine--tRNA ligase beta chain